MAGKLKRFFGQGILFTGWKNALVCLVLAAAVYFADLIYYVLNHGPAVLILRTPLDDAIPVVPIFVIPYVSLTPYVYFTLVVFLLLQTRTFQSTALAMLGAWLVSYACYVFLQTEVIRPALTGTDVFTAMIRQVYAGDNPFNDFPSLHTSISTIMAVGWSRVDRRLGIVAAIWTALIVASTVLIKQHYVADIAGGLLTALAAAWAAEKIVPQRKVDASAPRGKK
jgi:membrane-associated phospholipid phosphatase